MKIPSNNKELYDYLGTLLSLLKSCGRNDLDEVVDRAIHSSASKNPTEFMGETKLALQKVIKGADSSLLLQEQKQILAILDEIEASFQRKRMKNTQAN